MKEINVLILSAGRRVELINCFKAARDKLDIKGNVIAVDISSTAPALYFADKRFIVPRINSEDYISLIISLCIENNISLVVPTIDTELEKLAKNKRLIERVTNARVMISDYESVAVCCDKFKTVEFFEKYGFGYPKVVTESDIESGNYEFPLFIKPLNGSSSINAFKVNNKKELVFFLEYIKEPILQECVCGKEYTVDCFSDFDGNIITVVPRLRIATRGGEVLKGRVEKNRTIIEEVKRLIKKSGFVGQVTVQCFLCEDDNIKFIEINPRFGGGAPMSIMAGADSCENLYRLISGESLIYNEDWRDGITISRFDGSIIVE